jgi:HPt (histidine-containing phosphotransfer) domain-containing protein
MAFTNLDYLQSITEGDNDSMRELILLFIEQVPEFVGNLKKHLAEEEFIELGKEAHKAKSSVMIMGMDSLGHDLKTLQLDTISGIRKETYAGHVIRFETECLAAVEELNQVLSKMN